MSEPAVLGIHHVTAIASDAQANVDFYGGVLGLRLVKVTVNFDDPGAYHLYYGDAAGRPGTILTFFIWPGAPRGRVGRAGITEVGLSVPAGALADWDTRLRAHGVTVGEQEIRFGETFLPLEDPDGLPLALVVPRHPDPRAPWEGGPVPPAIAVRGVHHVTVVAAGVTEPVLSGPLGFRLTGTEGRWRQLEVGTGGAGATVLWCGDTDPGSAAQGAGTVHHVAFRTPDEARQGELRDRLLPHVARVTPAIDRHYFRSIYFRVDPGTLFEVATDPPGFTVDESEEELGSALKLPPGLEPRRSEIERRLPPFSPLR